MCKSVRLYFVLGGGDVRVNMQCFRQFLCCQLMIFNIILREAIVTANCPSSSAMPISDLASEISP